METSVCFIFSLNCLLDDAIVFNDQTSPLGYWASLVITKSCLSKQIEDSTQEGFNIPFSEVHGLTYLLNFPNWLDSL